MFSGTNHVFRYRCGPCLATVFFQNTNHAFRCRSSPLRSSAKRRVWAVLPFGPVRSKGSGPCAAPLGPSRRTQPSGSRQPLAQEQRQDTSDTSGHQQPQSHPGLWCQTTRAQEPRQDIPGFAQPQIHHGLWRTTPLVQEQRPLEQRPLT